MKRRHLLAAMAGVPQLLRAQPADPMFKVLSERLQVQGVGYAYARIDARGRHYLAAGRSGSKSEVPLYEDSLFELGSLTTIFTALLLADTVLRSGLKLDDPVDAALPQGLKLRDSQGQALRWIDLATHRSGLPRWPDNTTPRDPADPYAEYSAAQLHRFIEAWRPTRARGERYEHSSLGFGLLGHALSLRAGRSFAALLTERVIEPLGLEGIKFQAPALADMAQGHDADGKPVKPWHFGVLAGAGGLVGSAAGVGRFAQAALGLFEHPLGPAFALCMQRHADGPATINPTGLAWLRAPLKGRTLLSCDGNTAGFSNSLWLDPDSRRAAVVLSNAAVPVTDIALHGIDFMLPLQDYRITRQPVIALPAEALAALAGSYRVNPNFALVLSLRDGALWAQATGQAEFELFAAAPRRFFARQVPLEIVFDGDAGPPEALTLHQAGLTLRFDRER